MFDKQIYIQRRNDLAKAMQHGLILLIGNQEVGINYKGNPYPFRQDSSVLYYSGIERQDIGLIVDIGNSKSFLIGNEATIDDLVWTGPIPTLRELADRAGIDDVLDYSSAIRIIESNQNKGTPIHYLPIYRGDHAFEISKLTGTDIRRVKDEYSKELCLSVVHQREIKSKIEIEELEAAINTSGLMHRTMMQIAKAGMKESTLMAAVRSICLSKDVDIPYNIILSKDGQTLHNVTYKNILQHGQLVLGDFGAESTRRYAGDITRTIPVSKNFSPLQADIYSIVLNALNSSIAGLKNGVKYIDTHLAAARIITEGMKSLGFLKGDPEEIIAQGAHAIFYPHGLGHPLGLDVHDCEGIGEEYTGYEGGMERSNQFGLKSLRLAKELKTGMTITVEPGIYFVPELISLWKSEKKFESFIDYSKIETALPFGGIRIEDNVLILDHGAQILGKPIPKLIKEVEALRAEAYQ